MLLTNETLVGNGWECIQEWNMEEERLLERTRLSLFCLHLIISNALVRIYVWLDLLRHRSILLSIRRSSISVGRHSHVYCVVSWSSWPWKSLHFVRETFYHEDWNLRKWIFMNSQPSPGEFSVCDDLSSTFLFIYNSFLKHLMDIFTSMGC